jgi:hypothetical protein
LQLRRELGGRARPMSRIMSSSRPRTRLVVACARRREFLRADDVAGSGTSAPRACILSMIFFASPTRSRSASDLPIGWPDCEQERVRDAAADDQLVDLVGQRVEDESLVETFRSGDDRDQRPPRLAERRSTAPRARRPSAVRRTATG